MSDHGLGEVLRDGDRLGVRFVRDLKHPPERVWQAITESEDLRQWFPCDIVGERRAGASIELPFWPEAQEQYGEEHTPLFTGVIRAWQPYALFEWTWDNDELRWELAPIEGGTRLTFTTWFGEADRDTVTGATAGYHVCLDGLDAWLSGAPLGPTEDALDALVGPYREAIERLS